MDLSTPTIPEERSISIQFSDVGPSVQHIFYTKQYVSSSSSTTCSEFETNSILQAESKSNTIIAFSELQTNGVICLLDNCLNEFYIISSIIPPTDRPEWHQCFKRVPLKTRFDCAPKRSAILPEAQGLQDLTDLQKLQKDLCLFIETLNAIIDDIGNNNLFTVLVTTVQDMEGAKTDELTLMNDYNENLYEYKFLQRQISMENSQFMEKRERANVKLAHLDNEVHDAELKVAILTRYGMRWEDARISQNSRRLTTEETHIRNDTEGSQTKISNEAEVHTHIKQYIQLNQQDMEQAIENWMVRYDEDSERLDGDILQLKAKKMSQLTEISELFELFQKHRQEMDEWEADKAERARLAAEAKMYNDKATKLQAWWRGLMVRRYLGPFKSLRPAKAGKSAKGGKKK